MTLFNEWFGNSTKTNTAVGAGDSISDFTKEIYVTSEEVKTGKTEGTLLENWYSQRPYAFQFKNFVFYLPLSPSNINITTHFATNIISTMYGTVEEHSEQRYYDITISGTTGMSPRFYKTINDQIFDSISGTKFIGRAGYPIKSRVTALGGFARRTQELVNNTLNQASDIFGDENGTTGIDLQRTGYAAFHNFYKFLLLYKKDAVGEVEVPEDKTASFEQANKGEKTKTMRFINYKDNNQYDVAIQTFQLNRDASNPMLYNYNISMRAYNLRSADTQTLQLDVEGRATELGLLGIETTSIFTKLANKTRKLKNAAYSAVAAAKGFGS